MENNIFADNVIPSHIEAVSNMLNQIKNLNFSNTNSVDKQEILHRFKSAYIALSQINAIVLENKNSNTN